VDDLADHLERVVGAFAEGDEGDVGMFAPGGGADLFDLDAAGDDDVADPGQQLGQEGEPVRSLIRDQNRSCGFSAVGSPSCSFISLASLLVRCPRGDYRAAGGASTMRQRPGDGIVGSRGLNPWLSPEDVAAPGSSRSLRP
jgi:hypothetical protein